MAKIKAEAQASTRWVCDDSAHNAASWYLNGWVIAEVILATLFQILWWFEVSEFEGAQISVPMCISMGIRCACVAITWRRKQWVTILGMACLFADCMLLATCHPSASPAVAWGIAPPCHPEVLEGEPFDHLTSDEEEAMMRHDDGMIGLFRRKFACKPLPIDLDRLRQAVAAMHEEDGLMAMNDDNGVFGDDEEYDVPSTFQVDLEAQVNEVWHKVDLQYHREVTQDHVLVNHCLHMLTWYTVIFVLSLRQTVFALPISGVLYWFVVIGLSAGNTIPAQEMTFMALGWIFLLATKRALERSQNKVYQFMEKQRLEVLHEKVMRCEAEFKHEVLKGGLPCMNKCVAHLPEVLLLAPRHPYGTLPQATSQKLEVAESGYSAPSATSAPAILMNWLGTATRANHSGDCFPADAEVWVEGAALPKPVKDVTAGERLLCYDSIGRGPRFVQVADARHITGETTWVDVALADGTIVSMTANHPVRTQGDSAAHMVRDHVLAQNLRPGIDRLFVMKLVPELVESINVHQDTPGQASEEPSRVALLLQQPHRYEVFVTPGSKLADGITGVALGSANAIVSPGPMPPVATRTRHTFLEFVVDSGGKHRRAVSEPASGGRYADTGRTRYQTVRAGDSWGTRSESASASGCSRNSDLAEVILGFEGGSSLRGSQYWELDRKNVPSLGSRCHAQGDCMPCVFENRHQWRGREPCFKGFLCDRCHKPHESLVRPSGAQRRSKAKERPPGLVPTP